MLYTPDSGLVDLIVFGDLSKHSTICAYSSHLIIG